MLSPKAREHGRETRVSIAPKGDPHALAGCTQQEILARVQRSRAWLSKWQKRFDQQGTSGLSSRSRRPDSMPTLYSARIRQLIVQTRRRSGETKGRLDRCTCDPARVAQSKWRHMASVALDHQARIAVSVACIAKPGRPNGCIFPNPCRCCRAACMRWIGRAGISKTVSRSMPFIP